jgi:hypothetical protein
MEMELQARVPAYVWTVRFYAFHIIYMIKIINKLEKNSEHSQQLLFLINASHCTIQHYAAFIMEALPGLPGRCRNPINLVLAVVPQPNGALQTNKVLVCTGLFIPGLD